MYVIKVIFKLSLINMTYFHISQGIKSVDSCDVMCTAHYYCVFVIIVLAEIMSIDTMWWSFLVDYLNQLREDTDEYAQTKDALAILNEVAEHANESAKYRVSKWSICSLKKNVCIRKIRNWMK